MAEQIHDKEFYTNVRLPTDVKPIHYDVTLNPDLKKCIFSGKVNIEYVTNAAVNTIVLNANNIKILSGSINSNNILKSVTYSNETASLKFEELIVAKGTLSLEFQGVLNDKMQGFYQTRFNVENQTIIAATTQFEATDARQCIPCWDEPAIKATFSVTMVFKKWVLAGEKKLECVALSNMPIISTTGSDDSLEVKFDKTPIMSTYLLAFAVGPFELIEDSCKGRPVRVYSTPGKKEHSKFALEVACKSLDFFETYFDVRYPLPKMDLLAVPDFSFGAMENWGLIVYRETCLLVDPNNTTTARKQYVAEVVAHEIAHQWFGNLVTMEWWTHLWLNEGFASFMQKFCTDRLFPEYDMWSQFVTDNTGCAMRLDSLHNSHPIEVLINHPSEINEIFDNISYQKGSAVIRMLYDYIGDDSFRRGMKDYLSTFAYKNAVTEDLWDSLEKASNKPIRRIMSGWTAQKGYPWLSVEYVADGNDAKINIAQNKFTADGSLSTEDSKMTWMVPLSAITGDSPKTAKDVCLIESKVHDVTIKDLGQNWLKFNPGTVGLYRCAYSEELNKRLITAISDQKLPPMDRLGVQDDFYALCQAGHKTTTELLELLLAYKTETSQPVWQSISCCLNRLDILVKNIHYEEKFHSFGRQLFADIFKRLTWSARPGESHSDAILRPIVINQLISFGDAELIEESITRFRKHVKGEEAIPADLRAPCYKAVAVHGDEEGINNLIAIQKNAELQEEQNRALRSLGFVKDPKRREIMVKLVMSDQVRNQDKYQFFHSLGSSYPSEAWNVLRENKDRLLELYSRLNHLPLLVKACCENFASDDRAEEVTKYFAEHKFQGAERAVQQSIETIRLNANWLKRDSDKMKAFLSQY